MAGVKDVVRPQDLIAINAAIAQKQSILAANKCPVTVVDDKDHAVCTGNNTAGVVFCVLGLVNLAELSAILIFIKYRQRKAEERREKYRIQELIRQDRSPSDRTPRSHRRKSGEHGSNSERRDLMKSSRSQGYSTNDEERTDRRSHRHRERRRSKSKDKHFSDNQRGKEHKLGRKPKTSSIGDSPKKDVDLMFQPVKEAPFRLKHAEIDIEQLSEITDR